MDNIQMKTIVLSLKEDNDDRRKTITDEMNRMGIQFEFFYGVNGKKIIRYGSDSSNIVKLVYEGKSMFYDPSVRLNRQLMMDGDLGCAWSHLNIYEMLVNDDNNNSYLIFEDDAKCVVDKNELTEYFSHIPDISGFDICHIFYSEWYEFNEISRVNEYYFVPERRFFNRTGAYIVTKEGAKKLLARHKGFVNLPPDDLLSNTYIFDKSFRVIVSNHRLFEPTFAESVIDKINMFKKKYIIFDNFGGMGRLGNQMFQYACVRNLAIQNNMVVNMTRQNSEFFNAFDVKCSDIERGEEVFYDEKSMEYEKIHIDTEKNLRVSGYFQSEKYFEDNKDVIRNDFVFKKHIRDRGDAYISNLSNFSILKICIHVRRTDIINSDSPVLPLSVDFIERALEYILNKIGGKMYSVLIFSDDKEWCNRMLNISNSVVVSGYSDIEELYIMTQCSHFIIGSSSFSWWGSWLSTFPKKIVVMPDKWFSNKIMYNKPLCEQERDIYPESCIKFSYDYSKESVTLVTSYFNIVSKFNDNVYKKWMKNFLLLDENMVIFTDLESFNYINDIRPESCRTHIIITSICEFETYKYIDYWKYCQSIDAESHPSVELYMIWSEKTYFIQKAINDNIFNSKWFFWIDIGSIRNKDMLPRIKKFSPKNLPSNKVVLSQVCYDYVDKTVNKDGISLTLQNKSPCQSCNVVNFIQGGFFGGSVESLKIWERLFTEELRLFVNTGTFGGKDQYIYNNIFIKYPDNIHLLAPYFHEDSNFGNWFSFYDR